MISLTNWKKKFWKCFKDSCYKNYPRWSLLQRKFLQDAESRFFWNKVLHQIYFLSQSNLWPHRPELSNICFPWPSPQVVPWKDPCSIWSINFEYLERYTLNFIDHSKDGFQVFYPFPWLYTLTALQNFLN